MMNDHELDQLLRESCEREHLLEEINLQVMSQLKHTVRRNRAHVWLRATAFAFGLPLVLMAYFSVAYSYLQSAEPSLITTLSLILPGLILLCTALKAISDFSLQDV